LTIATGATILAIEDEPLNASLLRAILSPAGYDLHIEPTLADARDWLRGRAPDARGTPSTPPGPHCWPVPPAG